LKLFNIATKATLHGVRPWPLDLIARWCGDERHAPRRQTSDIYAAIAFK
jgi:hypothetical protein